MNAAEGFGEKGTFFLHEDFLKPYLRDVHDVLCTSARQCMFPVSKHQAPNRL